MSRSRKFNVGKSVEDFEKISFEINGETFNCKRAIQGVVLLEFARDASEDDGAGSARALYNFLESVLQEGEWDRLNELLHSDDVIIEIKEIGEIVSWLMEEYSDRPTKESKDS